MRKIPRLWLFVIMYVLGIVIWWALYYIYRDEFVVNAEVLRVEESQVRQFGRTLLAHIEDAFESRGVRLRVEEPIEWRMEERDGIGSIVLAYKLQFESPRYKGESITGQLIVVEVPGQPNLALARPTDAREDTETVTLHFQFKTFQRIITTGYDSKRMTALGALYFSMTTITTLGLGDIVPKSDVARLLVVTQVIFGLVVFALLCNSLVEIFSSKEKQKGKTLELTTSGPACEEVLNDSSNS